MSADPMSAGAPVGSCPFCLGALGAEEPTHSCPACHAVHHKECWDENGGCSVYGCTCVPAVEARSALEVPVSYWGQEHKPCPVCRQEILAAAVRCRHCGSTFATARPENSAEFEQRAALASRLPAVRRMVIVIFVLGIIPGLSPIGAVWGLVWGKTKREDILSLPPIYGALHRIGLVASCALTLVLILVMVLYALVRGS